MLSAAATDLRTLVEQYIYPIVVCDEDGSVRFCNGPAQTMFGGIDMVGRPLPQEWMDKEKVELDPDEDGNPSVYRLLWAEIMWEGNPAWYLVTYPHQGDSEELKSRLEQSMEMAASEVEKRQAVESDRERLEAKLRDLHQRSVAKLEAARHALEAEKAERQTLFERLTRLKEETDELKAQLEEKKLQVEEAGHRSSEVSQVLQAELEAKQTALAQSEEKAERYRRVYEELDMEMTKSQEQGALLSAKLRTAEARLDRAQRLLDGGSLEAISSLGSGSDEGELQTLRERISELEGELRRSKLEPAAPPETSEADQARLDALESQCESLRQELEETQIRLAEAHSGAEVEQVHLVDAAETEALRRRLEDTQAVVAELRLHKEQELLEARSALAKLQDLNGMAGHGSSGVAAQVELELAEARARIAELEMVAVAVVAGPQDDEEAASWRERAAELGVRVNELEKLLAQAQSQSQSEPGEHVSEQALQEANGRVGELEARVAELEGRLAEAPEPETGLMLDTSQWTERISELEKELERAQSESSPDELVHARNRISELELMVSQGSSAGGAVSAGDSNLEVQRLEGELAQAQAQLNDLARELRRTMDGDRETKKLAYSDQLTGLPNYNLTGQYLQVCFERSGRGEGALALILLDLDNFRRVNDALGTKSGDELLRQVGARLQRTVTEKDTAIARRGEDEFLVVAFLEGATVDGEALSSRVRGIAHNLLSELIKPFEVVDQRVQITASMGVALYPGPAVDREALLEQAEHAMYKAKEGGRARVSFYTQEIHGARERKIRVERELRQAVADGQFTSLFQPIVEIPSGKVVGLEALVRWSHPQRGLLLPAEFLHVAEEIGVIIQISDQIMADALMVTSQKFMKRRFMSFNLSHRQLVDASFPTRFMKILERAGVKPNEVMVEVSEKTTRMDPDRSRNTLAALAQWGVGIALDDFGHGASELSLFRDFPIKLLKVDGSLISKLPGDRETAKVCLGIARMAAALEIPVLAEGVETREQLETVSNFGFQYAQGMFLREPMNVNQLLQIL